MFTFISLMAIGALIGYPLRNKSKINKIPFLIHVVVCTLLFLLGLSIGINKTLVSNFAYFCEQAAIISSLSIMGSVFAAFLVYQLFFKKADINEK